MSPPRARFALAIPLLILAGELAVLRAAIRMDFNFDWAILWAVGLVAVVALRRLEAEGPWALCWQRGATALNLACLVAVVAISRHLAPLVERLGLAAVAGAWIIALAATLTTGCLVVLSPREVATRVRRHRVEVWLAIFAGGLLLLAPPLLAYLWPWLSRPTTFLAHALLRGLGLQMDPLSEPFLLKSPSLAIRVWAPCSGLEGMVFFGFVFALIVLMDWRRYSAAGMVGIALAGLAYMLMLNVLRVTLLFAAGVWAAARWGPERGRTILVWGFHANLGWILYLVGVVLFFAVVFRWRLGQRRS